MSSATHKKILKYRDHVPVTFVPIVFGAGGVMTMAQDYAQLGPPTEAYFVCARKEESDKLPVDLGSILRCLTLKVFTFSNDLLIVFCNLKPNQPIHNHNLTLISATTAATPTRPSYFRSYIANILRSALSSNPKNGPNS
ncbi:hypothetical protein E3Q09_04389 [Wallemia mellicola]|nr:hypothetical protein E3Q09_04389 [Wallemia mellicola]